MAHRRHTGPTLLALAGLLLPGTTWARQNIAIVLTVVRCCQGNDGQRSICVFMRYCYACCFSSVS